MISRRKPYKRTLEQLKMHEMVPFHIQPTKWLKGPVGFFMNIK